MADQSSFLKPVLLDLTYGASAWKKPVKVVATSNVAQTGAQTIDGVVLAAEDEVLCVGQSTAAQNGVWVVATGAWTRRTDCNSTQLGGDRLFAGCRVAVTQGTHADEVYRLVTTGRINVGVTAQTWELDTSGGSVTAVTGTGNISVTPGTTPQVSISATPSFTSVTTTSHVQVGAGAKRFQDAAPSAAGHFTVSTTTGRLRIYNPGGEFEVTGSDVPCLDDIPYTLKHRDLGCTIEGRTATTAIDIYYDVAPFDLRIVSLQIMFNGALTANDTNYRRIRGYSVDFSAVETLLFDCSTTVSAGTNPTGNWAAGGDITIPLTILTSEWVTAGSKFLLRISHGASGVLLPPFVAILRTRLDGFRPI